ncbi:MAG TPA: TetR/AcrR family transcriptional regulator [Chitinophagaceae bacterium]|nr:TetR/AcrR family transcriptional regulator [Chitinophagaceae bacterium]
MVKVQQDSTTEEKILSAARKVFIAKGMDGARMQDIADEAGINKALLHYYFRSKEKLFEEIFKELSAQFIPRVNALFESDLPLFEKIEIFCAEYISKMIENPFIPLFIVNEINKQPDIFLKKMWGGKKPMVAKLVQQIDTEVKKGKIKNIHPAQLLLNMVSMCIFPFIGKPLCQMVMGISDSGYRQLMEERKKLVPRFIIESISK